MQKFSSREEYEKWKFKKIKKNEAKTHKTESTEETVETGPVPEIDGLFEEDIPPQSFIELLPGVLSYPFKGSGVYLLIAGALFFSLLDFLLLVPIFGFLIAILVSGYMSAFMMKIISSSAGGQEEVPDWPDFTDFRDDILRPLFLLLVTLVFCFLPAIVYLSVIGVNSPWSVLPLIALIIIGLLYMPMGLIGVSTSDSVRALNPAIVIPSILKVTRGYLITCTALFLIVIISGIVEMFLIMPIALFSTVISKFISFYFFIIEIRIIGLLYYANKERLSWFGEDEEG